MTIGAVQLTWTSTGTDQYPDFNVSPPVGLGSPDDMIDGDVLRIQFQTSGGNWSSPTDYLTHTITSADMLGTTMSENALTIVNSGTYDFRARLERSGTPGDWGTAITVTIS